VADRNQDGLNGYRKAQGNWVLEIGWRMPRREVAGDICLKRQRPTQGCRSDGDDDGDDDDDGDHHHLIHGMNFGTMLLKSFFFNFLPKLYLLE
jgi:hypothetical protein